MMTMMPSLVIMQVMGILQLSNLFDNRIVTFASAVPSSLPAAAVVKVPGAVEVVAIRMVSSSTVYPGRTAPHDNMSRRHKVCEREGFVTWSLSRTRSPQVG